MFVKKRIKVILYVLMAIVCVLLVFSLYINYRGGKDYTEDLAGLMPADTMAYVSVSNLDDLVSTVADSDYMKKWQENGALDSFLQKNKRVKKWQKQKTKYAKFLPYDSELDFVERWMSRQLVLALIPANDTPRPGVIIASQTRIRFEEKLAAFVLENYPELQLAKEDYGGKTIVQYKAEKVSHGFCYTLFGRTVIISLLSPDTQYLRKIIDTYKTSPTKSLLNATSFKETLGRQTQSANVVGYVDLRQTPDALTFLKKKPQDDGSQLKAVLNEALGNYDYGMLEFKPERRRLKIFVGFLSSEGAQGEVPVQPRIDALLAHLPVETKTSLCWCIAQAQGSLVQDILRLSLINNPKKEKDKTTNARLTDLGDAFGNLKQPLAISFFIAPQNDSVNIFSVSAGLMLDTGAESKVSPQLGLSLTALIDHWRSLKQFVPLYTFSADNKIAVFMPQEIAQLIAEGFKRTAPKSDELQRVQAAIGGLANQPDPKAVQLYAELDLKRTGELLQNVGGLTDLLSKKKKQTEQITFWGKICEGFNSGRMVILHTPEHKSDLHLLIE